MTTEFKFPTEVIDLSSKGLLYPADSPLASGSIEMKYMTAKEEDILTNQSYLQKGIAIDKLLQSLIVTKCDYDQLLTGDKNAILIASRILGYGKDYTFEYDGEQYTVDLTRIQGKPLKDELFQSRENNFNYTLPRSGVKVTFKLLTHKDETEIETYLSNMRKVSKDNIPELSTRIKYMITSVEGKTDRKSIDSFVDNYLLAADSRALRQYIREIQPDVDLRFYPDGGPEGGVDIPLGVSFLWPDAGV